MRTAPGAHHWRIVVIEFLANAGGVGDIIALGDGGSAQSDPAIVPHNLVIDRCYIHGDPGSPQKRGIALNSAATTITGSYLAEIKSDWQDSQAIGAWNGPGPFTITNNYLEAAGENVMFGGGDPAIPNLVPSDIAVTNNTFSKPRTWRSEKWIVKNLFELKNARRVTIRGKTFEYDWQAAQSGFAILFTVRNQDGHCPWCQVEDVVFEDNVVRHVSAGVNILGFDDLRPSLQTRRITIRNNLFIDIDTERWGGTKGYFLQLLGGAADVTVDHNTVIQDHASGILWAEGPPIYGFTFTNNLIRHTTYEIIGRDHAPGNDTIAAYFPGSVIASNVIADANPSRYPANNRFPTSAQFAAEFVWYANGDYRLVPQSPWRNAGSDGRDLGAVLGPGTSLVRIRLDGPSPGQEVGQPFTIAGWAFDEGHPSGVGIDTIHVYAYPNPGSGQPAVFLGTAIYGMYRPDLGQVFGTRFGTAGFSLAARGLAPGVYQLAAFARSTLTHQFAATTTTVSVRPSTSVVVDQPAASATLRQPFLVSGLAVDTAAWTGVGVDAIHVWAYPADGSAPTAAGASGLGGLRPDVAAILGSQFAASGYSITVNGLPSGDYRLAVFARSTMTGSFVSRVVPVTIVDTARLAIDSPSANANIPIGHELAGWAVDTAASSGTGIASVHVWAFPVAGGSPTFVGVASYGSARPDIGAVFGDRFTNAGFSLKVQNLTPGTYDIAVYGWSTVSNNFRAVATVRVTVM